MLRTKKKKKYKEFFKIAFSFIILIFFILTNCLSWRVQKQIFFYKYLNSCRERKKKLYSLHVFNPNKDLCYGWPM